jgi:NAD(P)-dependent dehydrogenase (short-subunit alcohol dehydrogenase family)
MTDARSILITGCSSGFGLFLARTLADYGETVLATMRDVEGRNAIAAQELREWGRGRKGPLHVLELDVTDDPSVERAVQKALETAGRIDVLINNAGFGTGGYAESSSPDQLRDLFEVNVFGVHRMNRAVLPAMRERGSGLLVHVSSVMGRLVIPYAAPYTASKFALEGLAETYRYELSGTGVDVVIVEPGGFGTDFLSKMTRPDDPDRVASYGDLADAPRRLWAGLAKLLRGPEAGDPQALADAVVDLIQTPAGQRPLRTVVDPTGGTGARTINEATDRVQQKLLASFGMSELLSMKPST